MNSNEKQMTLEVDITLFYDGANVTGFVVDEIRKKINGQQNDWVSEKRHEENMAMERGKKRSTRKCKDSCGY